ncbi:MAG: hypothetical protein ACR2PH_10190 [Desulfobulbia bacterium]
MSKYMLLNGDSGTIITAGKPHTIPIAIRLCPYSAPHFSSSGLSIIAIDSDGGGSAAGVQLLITLFYEALILIVASIEIFPMVTYTSSVSCI